MMKKTPWITIIRSGRVTAELALCVLGALLLFVPGFSLRTVCIVAGVILGCMGAVRLIAYFSGEPVLSSALQLPGGLLLLFTGLFLFFRADRAIGLTGTILGLAVLLFGFGRLRNAIALHRAGMPLIGSGLIPAGVTFVVGLLLLASPLASVEKITSLIGGGMLVLGLVNLVSAVKAFRPERWEDPNIIEGKFREM